MASVSRVALEKIGATKTPCPVTILNGNASVPRCFRPLIRSASLGAGTDNRTLFTALLGRRRRLARRHSGPWLDVDLARATVVDDEYVGAGW